MSFLMLFLMMSRIVSVLSSFNCSNEWQPVSVFNLWRRHSNETWFTASALFRFHVTNEGQIEWKRDHKIRREREWNKDSGDLSIFVRKSLPFTTIYLLSIAEVREKVSLASNEEVELVTEWSRQLFRQLNPMALSSSPSLKSFISLRTHTHISLTSFSTMMMMMIMSPVPVRRTTEERFEGLKKWRSHVKRSGRWKVQKVRTSSIGRLK